MDDSPESTPPNTPKSDSVDYTSESTPPNTPKNDSFVSTSESTPTNSPKHDAVDNTSESSTPPNTPKNNAIDNTGIQSTSQSLHPFTGIEIDESTQVEQQNPQIASEPLHPFTGIQIDEPTLVEQQNLKSTSQYPFTAIEIEPTQVEHQNPQTAPEPLHPFTGIQIDEPIQVEQQNPQIASQPQYPSTAIQIDVPTQVEQQSSSQTHVDSKNPVFGYASIPYKCPRCKESILTAVKTRPNAFLWGISGLIFLVGFGLLLTISVNSYGSTFIGILLMFGSFALIGASTLDLWIGFKMFQDVDHHCPNCYHKIGTHSVIGTDLNANIANC